MTQQAEDETFGHRLRRRAVGTAQRAGRSGARQLTRTLGGPTRARVILALAAVLGLSGADTATVGASATQLRAALHISNTDIGLLVTVSSLVAAVASLPFGVLADRVTRTRTLGLSVAGWGVAMVWSAAAGNLEQLLWARLFLGAVTAAAGPLVASLVGDYFHSGERGRVYGYILAGEMVGAGFGFAITGDIAALSWRAAFVVLAIPAFALGWAVWQLPEPARGGRGPLPEATPPGVPEQPTAPTGSTVPEQTDAQRLAHERGIEPDPALVMRSDPRRMSLWEAARYVLRVRTNVILIAASAAGYYYLAGIETFGVEFVKDQYGINQAVANLALIAIGVGAVGGVLAGGAVGDRFLHRGHLNARIIVSFLAAAGATVLFVPAILVSSLVSALPYLIAASFCLAAQNPPLDAARLDIMPPLLWGRAEGVRTLLRSLAQALAPVLFGVLSDHLFGGGRSGLQATFGLMLVTLAGSAWLLFRARRTYPYDVATAAAALPPPPPGPPPARAAHGRRR